jgi:hypothetical protein
LHLNAQLIIRVGNSCITKTQNLPVFFLFEIEEFTGKYDKENLEDFKEFTNGLLKENKKIFVKI